MQKILSAMRKAITDYKMISDGDKIYVGLSGGKDSILLLDALNNYKIFSPEHFTLEAITIDVGFKDTNQDELKALTNYCKDLGIIHHIIKTDIAEIVFDERQETNPCSLCAKMRRGALNDAINSFGGGKLALGHNADDVAETVLMSLLYEGRFSCFQPTAYMSRSNITLIRPFIYLKEEYIKSIATKLNLPIVHNPCPMDKTSNREKTKELITKIQKEIPFAKDRILGAIYHPERNNLWKKPKA